MKRNNRIFSTLCIAMALLVCFGCLGATESVAYASSDYTVTYELLGGEINGTYASAYETGVGITLPVNVTKDGYVFGGWFVNTQYSGEPITQIGVSESGNKLFFAKWNPAQDTVYTVRHLEYQTGANRLIEVERKQGTTGELTQAIPKSYEGFRVRASEQSIVKANGSTVVDFVYERLFIVARTEGASVTCSAVSGEMTNPQFSAVELTQSTRADEYSKIIDHIESKKMCAVGIFDLDLADSGTATDYTISIALKSADLDGKTVRVLCFDQNNEYVRALDGVRLVPSLGANGNEYSVQFEVADFCTFAAVYDLPQVVAPDYTLRNVIIVLSAVLALFIVLFVLLYVYNCKLNKSYDSIFGKEGEDSVTGKDGAPSAKKRIPFFGLKLIFGKMSYNGAIDNQANDIPTAEERKKLPREKTTTQTKLLGKEPALFVPPALDSVMCKKAIKYCKDNGIDIVEGAKTGSDKMDEVAVVTVSTLVYAIDKQFRDPDRKKNEKFVAEINLDKLKAMKLIDEKATYLKIISGYISCESIQNVGQQCRIEISKALFDSIKQYFADEAHQEQITGNTVTVDCDLEFYENLRDSISGAKIIDCAITSELKLTADELSYRALAQLLNIDRIVTELGKDTQVTKDHFEVQVAEKVDNAPVTQESDKDSKPRSEQSTIVTAKIADQPETTASAPEKKETEAIFVSFDNNSSNGGKSGNTNGGKSGKGNGSQSGNTNGGKSGKPKDRR